MAFSNMQLAKNMSSKIIYDITNPQKHVIFKYAISKKHDITIIFMIS